MSPAVRISSPRAKLRAVSVASQVVHWGLAQPSGGFSAESHSRILPFLPLYGAAVRIEEGMESYPEIMHLPLSALQITGEIPIVVFVGADH
jgi:hypothetical protein